METTIKSEGDTEVSGTANYGMGDTRVLKNRVRLEGGVFAGVLETDRCVPDGYVVCISVQELREGNGPQRIQRTNYLVKGGKGVAL